jgi:hypothetical protein
MAMATGQPRSAALGVPVKVHASSPVVPPEQQLVLDATAALSKR